MKRITWILVGWLVLLATAQADLPIVGQERQKAHVVSRMYQASDIGTGKIRKLPLETKWDISPNASKVTLDFAVNEYRIYKFVLKFRYTDGRQIDDKLKKMTGNGSYQLVTQESADTDRPVIVPEYSKEELEFLSKGGSLVGGTYFNDRPLKSNERIHVRPAGAVLRLSPVGAGVAVPVHIKIEQIGSTGSATILSDEIIQTKGMESHSADALSLNRFIATARLHPGRYRLHADTTQPTLLPMNVETSLVATWDTRTRALKDDE